MTLSLFFYSYLVNQPDRKIEKEMSHIHRSKTSFFYISKYFDDSQIINDFPIHFNTMEYFLLLNESKDQRETADFKYIEF
jgi:hypothetical protein